MVRTANPRGQGARLRDELVDAASRLLEAGGRDAELTLRGVAREAGVSAPSVYAHFADLDALAVAVIQRHLADLSVVLGRSLSRSAARPPRSRLRSLARAYAEWGLAHPGPYLVVFEGRALRQISAEEERALASSDDLLVPVADLVRELDPPPASPELAALAVWTALHGVVSLRTAKPSYPWPALERHVDAVLAAVL